MQELTASIALQYNISEDLVQVIFTTTTRNLLLEHGVRVDIIIMATSPETFASVVNTTIALPMLQEVVRTLLPISLNEGAIVLCGRNEISIATACVCSRGHSRAGGQCAACPRGTVKDIAGDEGCGECSGNTFSATGATQCSACPLSATTRLNHTGCACNTGFVFFNSVCTRTEAVYMNVSGTLQMPEGAFAVSQLRAILLDGISAHLNFSREFITVIVRPVIESSNVTVGGDTTNATSATSATSATNATNATDATNATNATHVTARNSTHSGRRLLYALPVAYAFTALFQIPREDQVAYTKIVQFINDTEFAATTITDSNGYGIVLYTAELVQGYFSADGIALEPCADGRARIFESAAETLRCPDKIEPELVLPTLGGTPAWEPILIVLGFAVLAGGGFAAYRYRKCVESTTASKPVIPVALGRALDFDAAGLCLFPPRLQFPATVTFEYQLLPGHSV
jgi:hypothetical protein